jgi:hypothetical protein
MDILGSSAFQMACVAPCVALGSAKLGGLAVGSAMALNAGNFTLPLVAAGWGCIALAATMMWSRERASPKSQTAHPPSSRH